MDDEAAKSFEACLNADNTLANQVVSVRALLGLCRLAVLKMNHGIAAQFIENACALSPRDPEALLAAVTILPLVDSAQQPANFIKDHLQNHPDSAIDLSRTLVSTGKVELAEPILSPLASKSAEAALGYLVCCLVMDRELDLQVDVEQREADQLLKDWIHLLWQSRNTKAMEAFANGCGSVMSIFPWLPEFLQKETRTAS